MTQFPTRPFFIRNVSSGLVFDVAGRSTEPNSGIILWDKKGSDYENQLWSYENGVLINERSKLVLEILGYDENAGKIKPESPLLQVERKWPQKRSQMWSYVDRHLYTYDPSMAISGKYGHGSQITMNRLNFSDRLQEWEFVFP
ncbi:hypothetical protein NP233_g986 [Leucocoprinus birnbaumii]|uniref:Ricin B lectin domain-containing protein n=1 Tax=Leucocoprinus birnbaumii TaxID=56174 RepID=A0AAD5W183_9AGAR|nr:hypothetical protein NP233_g986 [Leucocoprinus birnbaumii]